MHLCRPVFIVLVSLSAVCSCTGMSTPAPQTNPPAVEVSAPAPPALPTPEQTPETPAPVQPATACTQTIDVAALAQAYNAFGLNLFQTIAKPTPSQNVFMSPLSVACALAMTYNGAYADTATAMADVLQVPAINLEAFNSANGDLRTALSSDAAEALLSIANSLWVDENITFRDAFVAATRAAYDAKLGEVDFLAPGTLNTINGWVAEATHNKITNLVKKDDLTADTLCILINAVYFKGLWETQFKVSETRDLDFTLPDGTDVKHPLMARYGSFAYMETPEFQAVGLPYRGGKLRMQVFLPARNRDLATFLATLTPENWRTWQQSFQSREGTVMLPRFKSEYECELTQPLSQLGMAVAFDRDAGDFRCMAICRERIVIDKVRHKAFVEVNEEGTEAAAATSVGMMRVTSVMPEEPFSMIVDRPFFYAITDTQHGALIFTGIMNDPRMKK